MAFNRTLANQRMLSDHVLQVIKALEGDANLGQPIKLTALSDAGNFALDVRNLSTGGALRAKNAAGTVLLQADESGVAVGGGAITVTQGTITADAPLAHTVTWNNAAVTFSGWKLNVTDTSSGANSLLLDLQNAGVTRFSVRKDGGVGMGAQTSPLSNVVLRIFPNAAGTGLSGSTFQYGIDAEPLFGSGATTWGVDVYTSVRTVAAAFTMTTGAGVYCDNASKGAGSAITSLYGVLVKAQTGGATNNYGVYIEDPSGGATENAAMRLGTTGKVSWNNDVSLSRSAAGKLATDSALVFTAAASKILPGATSISLRNNADSADNFLLLDSGVATVCAATATPAAGSTSARLLFGTTAGFGIYYGSNAPTVSAAQGSLYLRSDGSSGTTRAYINTNGATTWTAINTVA